MKHLKEYKSSKTFFKSRDKIFLRADWFLFPFLFDNIHDSNAQRKILK